MILIRKSDGQITYPFRIYFDMMYFGYFSVDGIAFKESKNYTTRQPRK